MSWTDRRTTSWVLEKVGTNMTLRQNISARKMRYFGHVMRKNDLVKTLFQATQKVKEDEEFKNENVDRA